MRSSTSPPTSWSGLPSIQRSWRSGRRGSTITTTIRRARRRRQGFCTHIAAARDDRPAARHPCARGGRRPCGDPEARDGEGGFSGRAALLLVGPRAGRDRNCARPLCLVFGHPDVQELAGNQGHRARSSSGSHPGGDGRALSRAAAASRQAERAGIRRPHRRRAGRGARRQPRGDRGADHARTSSASSPKCRGAEAGLSDFYRFTVLGCGSSPGVPRIGGDWGVCDPEQSEEPAAALLAARAADFEPRRRHQRAGRHQPGPARAGARRRHRRRSTACSTRIRMPTTSTASTTFAASS